MLIFAKIFQWNHWKNIFQPPVSVGKEPKKA